MRLLVTVVSNTIYIWNTNTCENTILIVLLPQPSYSISGNPNPTEILSSRCLSKNWQVSTVFLFKHSRLAISLPLPPGSLLKMQ